MTLYIIDNNVIRLLVDIINIALWVSLSYLYCTVACLELYILHFDFPEGTHIALLVTKVVHYSVYFT